MNNLISKKRLTIWSYNRKKINNKNNNYWILKHQKQKMKMMKMENVKMINQKIYKINNKNI